MTKLEKAQEMVSELRISGLNQVEFEKKVKKTDAYTIKCLYNSYIREKRFNKNYWNTCNEAVQYIYGNRS